MMGQGRNPGLRRALAQAELAHALATAVTLRTVCLSCGQTVVATIGGGVPGTAILDAGPCTPVPGEPRYTHAPTVWDHGERIR